MKIRFLRMDWAGLVVSRGLMAGLSVAVALAAKARGAGDQPPLSVDYAALVSHGDLTYNEPVARSEDGMPVGNGRMGSLVWTTPTQLKFQINRVDVFGNDGTTHSFPERHTDYGNGCAYLDINFVDFGDDVFSGKAFKQKLSLYDATMTARGNGISTRVIAWPKHDVMAVEVDDTRAQPSAVSIDLSLLRYAIQYFENQNYALASNHTVKVQTRDQTATSRLAIRDGRIVLTQEFKEGNYLCQSAVAVGVTGRPSMAKYATGSTVRLTAAPGKGHFTILIASAASFEPGADVAGEALKQLDAAANRGFDGLLTDTTAWWHDFWTKSFIHLHSADGVADYIEQNYTYFLYVMGASSRGSLPPRFGGMLWNTDGDMREWGSQFWWANMSCYYDALPAVNRLDLLDPVFDM